MESMCHYMVHELVAPRGMDRSQSDNRIDVVEQDHQIALDEKDAFLLPDRAGYVA